MANKQIKDFPAKLAPEGTDKILIQDALGATQHVEASAFHRAKAGFFDYNDLATATTPIAHNGSEGFKDLTNDGAGAQTNIAHVPTGVTGLWNTTLNQMDFTDLGVGDMIDIRVDVTLITTQPNQLTEIQLLAGIGGFSYTVPLVSASYKSAQTRQETSYRGIYIGDSNTLDNAAKIQIDSDSPLTVIVNGWYFKITRR